MTGQPFRLPEGGQIDRTRAIAFRFDGKEYQGFQGDSLAAALLAEGVRLMGRSFKYHRPRGLLSSGFAEPNALVTLRAGARREPNCLATIVELFEGLEARSQNRFPSLGCDILSLNQLFGRFLVAGFYYKTFMWPSRWWESVYEKLIRRSAGLGRAPAEPDPDRYEHRHACCDVLIVGGGVAGLSAASSASETGARVILVEQMAHFGGETPLSGVAIEGAEAGVWVAERVAQLAAMENVTLLGRTNLFGYYDGNVLCALERVSDHEAAPRNHLPRQRVWIIRAREVILACGAIERPMMFANNDLPGVMLSGAVRTWLDRFAVLAGRRTVVCTSNDDGYDTAFRLRAAGAAVPLIADTRENPGKAAERARATGMAVRTGTLPHEACGWRAVAQLRLVSRDGRVRETVPCDCVAMAGGFSPDIALSGQTGACARWHEGLAGFLPGEPVARERSAGACRGIYGLAEVLEDGHRAGHLALEALGTARPAVRRTPSPPLHAAPGSFDAIRHSAAKGKAFVDFQNDVTVEDIRLAQREGYVSPEHTKRYTTLGMGSDQGRTANVNGLAIMAEAQSRDIGLAGTTRFRPPAAPVALGAIAGQGVGRRFKPVRRTALHEAHERLGARFVEAGAWLRAECYPRSPGESTASATWREAAHVRRAVGMCDVSTLGKIELFGEDVAVFLNRLYCNGWTTLAVGRARYGLMLDESGVVFDDGTTSRLGADHYFMTTTTAKAGEVLAHVEFAAQVLWPELRVSLCSASDQWCAVAVAGPNARDTLAALFGSACDLSDDALPFMGVRSIEWQGVEVRLFRISFSGERAYEVNVPWHYGDALWNGLERAGKPYGIIPYGLEALNVLRIEKGHVTAAEIDGRTTPADIGLQRMVSPGKHFIGKRLLQRPALASQGERATMVGLKRRAYGGDGGGNRNGAPLRAGAHLLRSPSDDIHRSLGWVSSACDSPAMGCQIGLGFVTGGVEKWGGRECLAVFPMKDEIVPVEICHSVFFDPEGERLRG